MSFNAFKIFAQISILTFQAVFRNVNAEIGNPGMTCANIEVEEHTDCKCGCDVEVASCNSQQVSSNSSTFYAQIFCMNVVLVAFL